MAQVVNTYTPKGNQITVVANYSALPDPTTVSGKFYWCENSQGTSWLPGSLGGTYYNSGMYYSNGTSWSFVNVPYQATQDEVNTGTNTDKFVTPATLEGKGLQSKYIVVSSNQTAVNDANYSNVANASYTDPSPIEGKGFQVKVVNGTATIGGVGYSEGRIVTRTFHSGSWRTKVYVDETIVGSATLTALNERVRIIEKDPVQSANTSGVLETLLKTYAITGGTFSNGDALDFVIGAIKTAGVGTGTIRVKVNTVDNFATSTLIATFQNPTVSGQSYGMERKRLHFDGTNLKGLGGSASLATDIANTGNANLNIPLNPANNFWIYISIQSSVGTDVGAITYFKLTN